jgi:ferredoxin--NADP+ reductase
MNIETVLTVEHFNDKLFRFTTTKNPDYKFIPGQFTMIGLPALASDLMRAYSIASPASVPYLEFYSIKVPDGEFTNPLSRINVGDEVEIADRPVGSLMVRCLKPGKRLWLLSTGTGIAPFMSIVRDSETFSQFDEVILTHTVRQEDELTYQQEIKNINNLFYYPTVTRQPESLYKKGRITQHIDSGELFKVVNIDLWTPKSDRAMICGSTEFVKDMEKYFKDNGWKLGSLREPGEFLIERAFVSK